MFGFIKGNPVPHKAPHDLVLDGYRFRFAGRRDLDHGICKDLYGTRYINREGYIRISKP